ncbi:MAG TPA: hypothetical protein VGC74_13155 [Stenotrophomonas sp.]|jgi:hypothetical protein
MTLAPPHRSSFVSVMAWLSLAVALMSAAGNALQVVALLLMPSLADFGALLPPGTPLPAAMAWLSDHLLALSLWGVLLSLLLAWISWAFLQRREWARRAFIAGLVLVAIANFACIPLLDVAVAVALPGAGIDEGGDVAAQMTQAAAPLLAVMRVLCWLGALAIAGIHGWIAWRLCRPEIRAEFEG